MSPHGVERLLRRAALVLAVLASLYALVLVDRRAEQGRQALLRWKPDFERLAAGESIYHRLDPARPDVEGFPTPPVSALALKGLVDASAASGIGDRGACWVLAMLKLACAWLIALVALRLAFGGPRDGPKRAVPGIAALVVLLGCLRIDLSELAHGNINLLVGGCIAASLLAWRAGRDASAGAWAALGAAIKLTPALFLVYFAWKRSARAVLGFAVAYAAASWLAPGVALGFGRASELYASWVDQMIGPALAGAPLSLTQTEQINQSLTGVLARWLSDAVAIAARPPVHPHEVRIALVELSPVALRAAILGASLALLGVLAWATCARESSGARDSRRALAEYALVALAMLFLSERSWKQHYVLLPFAHAALAAIALAAPTSERCRKLARAALALSLILHAASADGLLGERASDYAEAGGAFLGGGLALYAVLALWLGRSDAESAQLRQT